MADGSFLKKHRLLSANDFSELKIDSSSFKRPSLIIYYKKNSFKETRIGLSVPKKIGKAHDRNRLKRIMRNFFRQSNYKSLGCDVLFVTSWSKSLANESIANKEKILLKNLDEFFIFLKAQVDRYYGQAEIS